MRAMDYQFFLGVDAVESNDGPSTALTLVEKEAGDGERRPTYRIHLVERGTDAEALPDRIQDVLTQDPFIGRTVPVVNRTMDAGQAVLDELDDRGLDAIGATLTAGSASVSGDTSEMAVEVSAQQMVDQLADLYHAGGLDVSLQQEREATSHLVRTVERFGSEGADSDGRVLRDEMGTTPANGAYDALVVSAGLACWVGSQYAFDPTAGLKERPEGLGTPRRDVEL